MRYSPKLQTEGDPTVPPGTKEMKEFKFIQAKICTESCASESPPFQPQPQLIPAFFRLRGSFQLWLSHLPELEDCSLDCH